jgi:hypothetical protein
MQLTEAQETKGHTQTASEPYRITAINNRQHHHVGREHIAF